MNITIKRIKEISELYGNAYYLLDSKQFKDNYLKLKDEFSNIYPFFNIAYSYKTNYIPRLCKIVNELGGYAEVVSEMEMDIALNCGVNPKKIIWNGPVKNKERLIWLLNNEGTVNVDSIDELRFINDNVSKKVNIGLRCNFDVEDGVISRFGVDVDSEDYGNCLDIIKQNKLLHLIDVQCHFAKRKAEFWPKRAEGMISVVKNIKETLGYYPERVDLGGGIFGNMPKELEDQLGGNIPKYKDYANAVGYKFKEAFPNNEIELLVEPGTALAGDVMSFVGKIETIKTVRGKHFATMMGSQKNISMTGVNPPIVVHYSGDKTLKYNNLDIVGYTCIESDVIYKNYNGELAVGDYVEIKNCGSYSIVMKPPFILPNFPVLDITNGKIEVIKRKEEFNDLFLTYGFNK